MKRWLPFIIIALLLVVAWGWLQRQPASPIATPHGPIVLTTPAPSDPADVRPQATVPQAHGSAGALPAQARETIARIQSGGPFPFNQDGVVFSNREGLLPQQPRGYYHEYTVVTPGAGNRGTRRIITGGTPPAHWYYTDDHYRSFREFTP